MKTRNIFFFVCCLPLFSFSQNYTSIWKMGYNQGGGCFNFNFDSVPVSITSEVRPMSLMETNASICNSLGQINFYTNGVFIANRNNDTMMNGSGLNPGTYVAMFEQYGLIIGQADIILPFPNDSLKFYLFHETADIIGSNVQPLNLYQSIVDMSLDGGLGAVTIKNNSILQDTLIFGELTACKHANGRDWWLICHKAASNFFYKLLITPNGIESITTQSIGSQFQVGSGGQTCFSPDGKWYARYNAYDNTDLDIFSFDRCTGDFSNPINVQFNDSAIAGGVAFSPNSQVLYVPSTIHVYQFDLTSSNIPASQKTVATWDGFYSPQPPFATLFYMAQLANDGKIYITSPNGTSELHVINYPNLLDTLCEVCQHCVHMPSYNITIPNHPNYYLRADTTSSICDSLSVGITKPKLSGSVLQIIYQPAAHYATIHGEKLMGKTFSLSVFDLAGREVFKEEGKLSSSYFSKELNCQLFASGMFVVSLQTEKEKLVKRFVK